MAQVWCDTTLQGGGKPGPYPIRLSINRSWEGKRRPGDSVARGWGVVVLLQGLSEMNRYAGDHKGPPCPASSSLAPTDYPALCLTSRLRLMPIGRPSRVPWQSFTDSGLVDNRDLHPARIVNSLIVLQAKIWHSGSDWQKTSFICV